MRMGVLVVAALCTDIAIPAAAQAPIAAPGTSVLVDTVSDEEVAGRLLEVSPTTLAMLVNDRRVELPLARVRRVRERDSLLNGALIGALVAGGWCAVICGQGLDASQDAGTAILSNAGLGALIGMLIDRGHRRTLFSARRGTRPESASPDDDHARHPTH